MTVVLILITAYMLGSIPFGFLIVSAMKGLDIRRVGSGGTGATNVIRGAGRFAGLVTLLLDVTKGAVAIALAQAFLAGQPGEQWFVAAAGLVAILGHIFPLWLRFKGGKGVATAVGAFLMLSPMALVPSAVAFLVVIAFSRYVSLASITASIIFPIAVFFIGGLDSNSSFDSPHLSAGIAVCALILFTHRANIQRLLSGIEAKFR